MRLNGLSFSLPAMKKRYLLLKILLALLASMVFVYYKASREPIKIMPESSAFNAICQQHFEAYYDLGMGRYHLFQNGKTQLVYEGDLNIEVLNSFKKIQACVLNSNVIHGTGTLIRDRLYISMHELH